MPTACGLMLMLHLTSGCTDQGAKVVERPVVARTAPKLDPKAAEKMINAYRAGKGLRPVVLDPKLMAAAKAHSADLAAHDSMSHSGSDGSSPWTRIQRTGYHARFGAENVAVGQVTLDEVVTDWKQSRKHNENLLQRDATAMGIALVYRPNTKLKSFWTLVLGAPL